MPENSDDKPLLKYLSGLVKDLHDDLPVAQKGDVEAIHDVRVATRRLKAAMELFEPHLTKTNYKRFGKALKKVRRTFGDLRDLDVMLEHLSKIRGQPATGFLSDALKNERADELGNLDSNELTQVFEKLSVWWELRDEIEKYPAEGLLRASLKTQWEGFRQKAEALSSGKHAEDIHPHELRIVGKALRYTLEMAKEAETDIKTPAALAKSFKSMQDLLGSWHDFIVLTDNTMSTCVDEELGYRDPALQREMLKLAQYTARRAEQYLNQFGKLWKKQGSRLNDQLSDAIEPLSAPAQVEEVISPLPSPPPSSLQPTPTHIAEPAVVPAQAV